MDILTTTAQNYITTFSGYVNQFLQWGQWLFFSLLVINIVWMALWLAFDRHSFSESMPSFIKKFFVIAFFYTIMMNPSWLGELLKTVQFMGTTLTHTPIDPSSIVSEGIGIGNQIIIPIEKSSLLTLGFGVIIISIVYIIVLFVFISIALDLALTLIITTALIAMTTFLLGFAALGATTQIARQTLDVILANCVKLLGIYLVVAAGSQTMIDVSSAIPTRLVSFDPYAWIVACALLFWLIAKNLPNQLAKIVTDSLQETRGTDAPALAVSAVRHVQTAMPPVKLASNVAQGIAKIAGSAAYNAGAHFNKSTSSAADLPKGLGAAVGGSMAHFGKAVAGNLSDHFKHIASKLAGGPGSQQPISGISERMYKGAKDMKSKAESHLQSGAEAAQATMGQEERGVSKPRTGEGMGHLNSSHPAATPEKSSGSSVPNSEK
jgi:P-type conjugative transfer protein TrbL